MLDVTLNFHDHLRQHFAKMIKKYKEDDSELGKLRYAGYKHLLYCFDPINGPWRFSNCNGERRL